MERSPISIAPGFTGIPSQALIEAIKKETGARAVAVLCLDDTSPCAEDKAGRPCTFGHRFNVTLDGMEHFNLHEFMIQILGSCPGHKKYLRRKDDENEDI